MLSVGNTAPSFSLPDQVGTMHSLEQYHGKWVILYLYPKDDTTGCTKEACGFRDAHTEFENKGIVILGLSKDSVKSHGKFASKYALNFPILSDESTETIKAYESFGQKKFMGRTYMGTFRNTFLINPQGKLAKVYENVNPLTHPEHMLQDIKNLS
ncbi:thioredoxin-dependent thiol peroxidase [Candidatus Cerribacteria bacterium 'Amazon FNV 2010 28 9']|uniref:thioredoxin-dependent peroxiredoxin n=1 Tax=Candidatus Cerribacteria bacterium 'Amazon FNV 2010 28 9' TaxID=2081795 RepID=A0A317JQF9_9BACT|nr:MAG: thioredoxin-dependent thiol peroxidase [Candidatus Cerribacteria bacterium 'Amazon FNV 2010 28 9']